LTQPPQGLWHTKPPKCNIVWSLGTTYHQCLVLCQLYIQFQFNQDFCHQHNHPNLSILLLAKSHQWTVLILDLLSLSCIWTTQSKLPYNGLLSSKQPLKPGSCMAAQFLLTNLSPQPLNLCLSWSFIYRYSILITSHLLHSYTNQLSLLFSFKSINRDSSFIRARCVLRSNISRCNSRHRPFYPLRWSLEQEIDDNFVVTLTSLILIQSQH
jgi:hypothetical protein